jgi:hypothetical protein
VTQDIPAPRRDPSTIATIGFLLWGLIVWGLQFSLVYIGHTWLCALGWQAQASSILVGTATAFSVALIAPIVIAPAYVSRLTGVERQRPDTNALIKIARLIGAISLIAAIWTGAAALIVQACVSLR